MFGRSRQKYTFAVTHADDGFTPYFAIQLPLCQRHSDAFERDDGLSEVGGGESSAKCRIFGRSCGGLRPSYAAPARMLEWRIALNSAIQRLKRLSLILMTFFYETLHLGTIPKQNLAEFLFPL